MKTLKELSTRLKELRSILSQSEDGLEAGTLVALGAAKMNATAELELLTIEYKQTIASNLEFVLLSGPGEENAAKALKKAHAVLVDSQNFYDVLAAGVKDLVPNNGLHTEAFAKLVQMTRNLQSFTGAVLHTGLSHTPSDPTKSIQENARILTRTQLGGAGVEPLAVLMDAVLLASEAGVSKSPVIVGVTNLHGATESDYAKYLKSVNSYTFETGDTQEVKSMIRLLKQKLVSENKMENEEPKQEGVNNEQQ